MPLADTIAAIATAIVPDQGSIGVVRLSGPEALAIAKVLFNAPGNQTWESHRILYGYVRDPQTQTAIDEALLLLMLPPVPTPKKTWWNFNVTAALFLFNRYCNCV